MIVIGKNHYRKFKDSQTFLRFQEYHSASSYIIKNMNFKIAEFEYMSIGPFKGLLLIGFALNLFDFI